MKKVWILGVMASIALVGCGGIRNKIIGTWKLDESSVQIPGVDEATKNKVAANFKAMDNVRLSFNDDGTYAVSGIGSTKMGKWFLSGHNIVINEGQTMEKGLPTLVIANDGSKIHMSTPSPVEKGDMLVDLVKIGP